MNAKDPVLKERIINAARVCFYEQGYTETSLATISRRAKTAISNFYTYFSGKEEIFDAVLGNTIEVIDKYIEVYYKKIIEDIKKSGYKIENDENFQVNMGITPELSMNFSILLNGSEGTRYESYKHGLKMILRDYAIKNMPDEVNKKIAYSDIISHIFIVKMLSGLYEDNKENNEENNEEDVEVAKFSIDKENKTFGIRVLKWITNNPRLEEKFVYDYHNIILDIDTTQYKLEIDVRDIANVAEDKLMDNVLNMYKNSNFKEISVLLSEEQIAFEAQHKRVLKRLGMEEVKVHMISKKRGKIHE